MTGDPFKLNTSNSNINTTTSLQEDAPIKSTIPKKSALFSKKKPAVSIEETDQVAKNLGFSSRESAQGHTTRRKPGRKRVEPQSRVLVSGPERVLERFKAQSEANGITYWEYIEMLMGTVEK